MTSSWKIRGKCVGCRKQRWLVRKRKVMLPIGKEATSHDLICGWCYTKLLAKLNQPGHEQRPIDNGGNKED